MLTKPEKLNTQDTKKIADYVKLALDECDLEALTDDLNNSIELLKPITEYDLTGVEPTFHPIAGLTNVMRSDSPNKLSPSFTQDETLQNATDTQDGQFRIPPIL